MTFELWILGFISEIIIKTMKIPKEVELVIKKLQESGYEAYIVGGCVRDILRGVEPNDWDVATEAKPEEVGKIFLRSFTENKFGTVTVLTGSEDPKLKEIEITTYRIDEKYTDKRHPDKISWAKTIEEDLARRDFTINAMALDTSCNAKRVTYNARKNDLLGYKLQVTGYRIVDPFEGQKDLKNKVIRAVRNPAERFSEDALRMLRAIRFAVSLEEKIWQIEEKTAQGIKKNVELLNLISKERIRDELIKIINSLRGARGIEILRRLGLLKYIIPELEQGFGVWQNKHHIYQVYEHALLSLNYACQMGFSKNVRIAALFHDIGKPKVKQGEGPDSTFYNHEIVGAKMTQKILERLRFPKKDITEIVKLVKYHLFYYNVGEVSDSSVRRLLRKVGQEDVDKLLEVRQSDRIGSGVPKAEPYKLRYLRYTFEKVSQDPISPKTLKVSGDDVMRILNVLPGPKVGHVLSYLLGQVLSDPKKNVLPYLEKEIERLGQMSDEELEKLARKAKEEIEKIETKRDEMTRKKYWVT